jgi:alpha-tubulin suppressor-like RCC1 family protein
LAVAACGFSDLNGLSGGSSTDGGGAGSFEGGVTPGRDGDGGDEAGDGGEVDAGSLSAVALATGYEHACAVGPDARLYCWGSNLYGQLGDGTTVDRDKPTQVLTLTDITSVATGYSTTCALGKTGQVWCWGDNGSGIAGTGQSTGYLLAPGAAAALPPVIGISTVGTSIVCAWTASGDAYCWGVNVGPTPTRMFVGSHVTSVSSNAGAVCAVLLDGTLSCVASVGGADGGTPAMRVTGLSNVVGVVPLAYYQYYAWTDAGAAYTFQANSDAGAIQARGLVGKSVAKITTGGAGIPAACALLLDGSTACWGGNSTGMLGDGTATDRDEGNPTAASAPALDSLSFGGAFACGVTKAGQTLCWGSNRAGQLGIGKTEGILQPVAIPFDGGIAGMSLGIDHSCAWTSAGQASCWGRNDNWQLGDGTRADRALPAPVKSLPAVAGIAVDNQDIGPTSTDDFAWTADGKLFSWGVTAGSLGKEVDAGPGPVSHIAASGRHRCRLTSGNVYCEGDNSMGQLGDGTTAPRSGLVKAAIPGASPAVGISAGTDFTCAWTSDKKAYCWGTNDRSQLGIGAGAGSTVPTPTMVQLAAGILGVSTGWAHACAWTDDQRGFCWGDGNFGASVGQLTPGVPGELPLPVGAGGGVAEIAAVGVHGHARLTDGTLVSWGGNFFGAVGDGTVRDAKPVLVSGVSGLVGLARGWSFGDSWNVATEHMCAWSPSTLWCWGWNEFGQVGNGTSTARWAPTPVIAP